MLIAYRKLTNKNVKHAWKEKNIKSERDFIGIQDNKLSYKCKKRNKKWLKPVDELIKKFSGIYQFCNGDLSKFVLLLRKRVYPYEDMDSWEKFDETTIPPREFFCSKLNLENITDKDYAHPQEVWDAFEIKDHCKYHHLYVLYDTLLLADVFENFKDKCIEIYEFDLIHFGFEPELPWQACLKKTEVKLELITNYEMLMIVENGIRGEICQATHRYAKANNKYMNNYDKNIESSYIKFLDANNLYGWAMSQKLPVNGFIWVKKLSKFNEDFIKKYVENSNIGYFLEVAVE